MRETVAQLQVGETEPVLYVADRHPAAASDLAGTEDAAFLVVQAPR